MKTFIFGAGGHGKVVLDILLEQGVRVDGFVDATPRFPDVCGVPVLKESDISGDSEFQLVIAVGANHTRRDIALHIQATFPKVKFINAIHPSASISKLSILGVGNVFGAGAIVTPGTVIGSHIVLNTGAQVDHDCILADFTSVAPGAVLGGGVKVGIGSYVGIGATIKHGIEIGEWSVIGADSTTLQNVPSHVVAYGSPCKVVRERKENEPYL